ncbi:MAG: VWA domain-containing protein [Proteobacteria bacterium]|nr:VWA domain-containing protein [Pseudomonadota bacterium]
MPSLPDCLEPLLDAEPGPRDGVVGHQVAMIWQDRLMTVELEASDGSLEPGESRTTRDGALLKHVRCALFSRAELPATPWGRYPLFLAAVLLLGVPVGFRAATPPPPQQLATTVTDTSYLGRIAFSDAGLPDVNPDAGQGLGQLGEAGDAGTAGHRSRAIARGAARGTAREEGEGTPGLAGGDGPNLNEGNGRVEPVPGRLTSVDDGEAEGSGLEGQDELGSEGQMQAGVGAGAEGSRARIAGLARAASWIHQGRGLRGPGSGPGSDRDGIDDGDQGVTYMSPTPRGYVRTLDDPTSYVTLDVDRASFARARGALAAGDVPSAAEIRPEEFVNAMPMGLERSPDLSWEVELGEHRGTSLLRVTVQLPSAVERVPLDVVLLVDDSCSMRSPEKLELVKSTVDAFLGSLEPEDRVRMITFSDMAPVEGPVDIHDALQGLEAVGRSPLALALDQAASLAGDRCEGGRGAVLALADGGSDWGDLQRTAQHVMGDLQMSVVGFGRQGFDAEALEELALISGGSLQFVDRLDEAELLMADPERLLGTLDALALHVDFGEGVHQWRLVGYGSRQLAESDGEAVATVEQGRVGVGSTVTAL